jgi:integrase
VIVLGVRLKATTVIIEELDERGRYISASEFKWIMDYFKDRYDPRRLSFALGYTTGLRCEDYVKARIRWFSPDFKEMKMSQCKAHVRKKDGVVQARVKPKFVPLPEWLAEDLKNYAAY